jgi:hypothetical protein
MTHYYYHNILDYSQFSIFIEEKSVDRVEEYLLSISDERLLRLQSSLILIRSY